MLEVTAQHKFTALDLDVTFSANEGITVLFGASGSGKTTIANIVAGLVRPDKGRICVGDTVVFDSGQQVWVPPYRRNIGYIFQDARLFPHLSVSANLRFGRWFSRNPLSNSEMGRVIELLGLRALLARRPAHLSGGEKQRVAIGRAVFKNPDLLIADEPLAALDLARKAEIVPYFERLRDELHIPMLYVSHSTTEVARLATSVVALSSGRIWRQGSPTSLFADPSILPLGPSEAGAILPAQVVQHCEDGLTELCIGRQSLFVPRLNQSPGTGVNIRIAASDVIIAHELPAAISALNILSGTVLSIQNLTGHGALVSIDCAGEVVVSQVTKRSVGNLRLKPGKNCFAIVKSVAIS